MLEFPEAYFDEAGQPLADGGFDAVLGNPPWDMLRAGGAEKTFFRSSGVYRHQGAGRINRYQMFVERALTLTKRGGRIGLVLPAGFATDHTSAPLRRTLLSRTSDRYHQRLRQSARHLSHSQKRSIPHLHVDRWRGHAPHRLPLRHRRSGRARNHSRQRRPADSPLASDRADALVHRSAQRTHVRHTRAAHARPTCASSSVSCTAFRGSTPRTAGTCGSDAS